MGILFFCFKLPMYLFYLRFVVKRLKLNGSELILKGDERFNCMVSVFLHNYLFVFCD